MDPSFLPVEPCGRSPIGRCACSWVSSSSAPLLEVRDRLLTLGTLRKSLSELGRGASIPLWFGRVVSGRDFLAMSNIHV